MKLLVSCLSQGCQKRRYAFRGMEQMFAHYFCLALSTVKTALCYSWCSDSFINTLQLGQNVIVHFLLVLNMPEPCGRGSEQEVQTQGLLPPRLPLPLGWLCTAPVTHPAPDLLSVPVTCTWHIKRTRVAYRIKNNSTSF